MDVDFRRLRDDDLPLLHRWLNEPGVVHWWEGDDVTWEAVVRDYGSASTEPAEFWIATTGGDDVGWIQCYATADYPEEAEVRHWWALGAPRTTCGIDYLVGDPRQRGRGIGSAMIRAFVTEIVFSRHPEWTHVGASPVAANVASVRALAKAGFTHAGTFVDEEHGPCTLMIAGRSSFIDPWTPASE